jgi:hypothetical protein
MGWSCAQAAFDTLDKIKEMYDTGDGSSNTIYVNGLPGFFEETRRDQPGGAICGTVYRRLTEKERAKWSDLPDLDTRVIRAGSFKIDGSGKVVRFPGVSVKMINKKLGYA